MNEDLPYVDLAKQHAGLTEEIREAVERVLSHGRFILGEEVEKLEQQFARYCGTRYAVGVGSGTDAITLVLRALDVGPGDEVITVPNSFVATASAIVLAGATPVFVDVRDDYNMDPQLVDAAVTRRTRALVPVHLTGRPADMHSILAVAGRYGLAVVEDAAQAAGARYHGRRAGSFGIAGCFSLHPLKNLSACGDGGMITTDDASLFRRLCMARNHGLRSRDRCEFWGENSRLDAIQAAILGVKFRYLDGWIDARRQHAAAYREHLGEVVQTPREAAGQWSVYHTFVVQASRRDALQQFLAARGIGTRVHYPTPIHLQPAARSLGYQQGDFPLAESQARHSLSLPIYPELSADQVARVAAAVRSFYEERPG